MTKVLCFANNKGGSGKSTTCSSVGYVLAGKGKKVLLVDADGQMNLTLSCFSEEQALGFLEENKHLYYGLSSQVSPQTLVVATDFENLYMLPGSPALSQMEGVLHGAYEKQFVLRKYLERIKKENLYDYILIDAPPALSEWTTNIMCASDGLIIPVEASPWGLFGLANMLEFYTNTLLYAPDLQLYGVLVTKADVRKNYFKQTMETLSALPDVRVFSTVIHVDSHVEWAQENSRPVGAYAKSCRAAKEYVKLAKEIEEYAGW